MSRKIIQLLSIIPIYSIFILCSGEPQQLYDTSIRNGTPHITNHAPQYESSQFVELNKLYRIPTFGNTEEGGIYEISLVSAMDLDEDENLYVLGPREREISVFDKNGNHLRTFGGRGQGPQELMIVDQFIYDNGFLYIIEEFKEMKIWDLYGNYIDKLSIPRSNYALFQLSGNEFITGEIILPLNTESIWKFTYKKHSKDMLNATEILSYDFSSDHDFNFETFLAFSRDVDSNFYFPENKETYTIIKYANPGEPMLSFSRDYDPQRFTVKAEEIYNSRYEEYIVGGTTSPIPEYPPIIRKTLIDSRGNIWIVSGETAQDNDDPDFQSTVDIFDSEGKWLQSFKSTAVTLTSIIRNDRLYSPSLYNDRVEQFIDVFEIIYK